jgi:hypothetical protein
MGLAEWIAHPERFRVKTLRETRLCRAMGCAARYCYGIFSVLEIS